MGGIAMKKTQLASVLLSVLVLTGCATNEAAIVETTANSFNETPLIIEERLEESQISQETSSSEPEQSEEIESSEVIVSSKEAAEEVQRDQSSQESISVESEEAVTEPEVIPIAEGVYTNYELESELIEDERIANAMTAVVTYLKENNHYFDSAEYHFTIKQLTDVDLIELSIAEQYSDGEIVRGVFDYDLSKREIATVHK